MRRAFPVLAVCLLATAATGADDLTKLTPQELFKKADKNGDGKLSPDEFQTTVYPSPKHAPKLFTKSDKDRDGKLSLDELTAALDSVPWWKLSRKSPEELFKTADKNGDGKLSLDEFKEVDPHKNHFEAHFKKFDKDGDGMLTLDEFKAFVETEVKDKG